ncbi:MAG: CYTH domain-containing protein [Candidatus Sungbacteria bacterium]|uniref:CYTH domain-containing protein n=1 Tax=Candidatus Sungiibacteriota bacterium TaxID=2750080 RepID=A0A932QXX7_9BACT|nr:CYTH domain-containing protein [Candidatus Sungbacteria bacterium]
MIEVEKKFILTGEEEARLLKGAEFIGQRMMTDVYYDTADYALTMRDWWLRNRDGRFELKCRLKTDRAQFGDEIEGEETIRQKMNIGAGEDLACDLAIHGYAPFCTCRTMRRKYRKGLFTIDCDAADMDGFVYHVAEIELMVSNPSEADEAMERIMTFARNEGLATGHVAGKIAAFLREKKPDHYRALARHARGSE